MKLKKTVGSLALAIALTCSLFPAPAAAAEEDPQLPPPVQTINYVETAGNQIAVQRDFSLRFIAYGDEEGTTVMPDAEITKVNTAVTLLHLGSVLTLHAPEDPNQFCLFSFTAYRDADGDGVYDQLYASDLRRDGGVRAVSTLTKKTENPEAGLDALFAVGSDRLVFSTQEATELGEPGVPGETRVLDATSLTNVFGPNTLLAITFQVWPKFGPPQEYHYNYLLTGQKADPAILDPAPTVPAAPTVAALPNAAQVLVDGKEVSFDAYNINGNNYFKLRDLAYILNGSDIQFEVGFNGAENLISLATGKPYTPNGSEMQAKAAGPQTAIVNRAKLLLDGCATAPAAYNINGNNYFKLRDLGSILDFGVEWDAATGKILITVNQDA